MTVSRAAAGDVGIDLSHVPIGSPSIAEHAHTTPGAPVALAATPMVCRIPSPTIMINAKSRSTPTSSTASSALMR